MRGHPVPNPIGTIPITLSTSGVHTVVAGVPNMSIVITELVVMPASAVTLEILSGSTSRTGPMPLTTAGFTAVPNYDGHIATAAGDNLVFSLGTSVQLEGFLSYRLQWAV